MSNAELIRPHIPLLRRYARILSGSQAVGDAYVSGALEALISGKLSLRADLPARVACYKLFQDSLPLQRGRLEVLPGRPGDVGTPSQLDTVSAEARQALLLSAVEEFSRRDIGLILDIAFPRVDTLLAEAHASLRAGLASEILIIEDEPIIALDLKTIIESDGHTHTGIARTRDEAVALAAGTRPQLILADIRLADGSSGVDAVQDILTEFEVPVIFITAYPETLLTGERPEPTYLITKPFMPETVLATISQALFLAKRERQSEPAAAG
ncbi:response regulator [Maricaulis maris]|uniref:Response regulator receiver domain-containing protein n=1 Tax=Maricaulis maris TaxID=74318 RepID=A0A495D1R5_9PROT|nr:response regulator [Maricaulis maris]RKQ95476.1 response regulator receiver domain-containing protein [Maricaulis maris]